MDNPEKMSGEERASIRDQLFELEQRLEKQWIERVKEERERALDDARAFYERRSALDAAYSRVAQMFLSVMHTKAKNMPSIIDQNGEIDENAMLEMNGLVSNIATLGCDFEVIVNSIHSNPLLLSEWERFTSMLRLAE